MLILILGFVGECTAILVVTRLVSIDVFTGMPFASRDLFILLAVGLPFVFFYFWLLATRNFEDIVVTDDGIALPVRSFREMLRDARHVLPFSAIESLRFYERRGSAFIEVRLVPAPGRRPAIVFPALWIPDEAAFEAGLRGRVVVVQSRPLRGTAAAV